MRRVAWAYLVLAACSSDPPEHGDEPPVVPPVVPTTGPATLPTPPPHPATTIRLLSAGTEPRRALRYRPTAGARSTLTLAMSFDMAMSSGGHRMFGRKDQSTGKLGLRVARVEPDGTIFVDVEVLELSEPSFDPQRPGRTRLAGLTGTFTLTDRGQLISASPSLESAETKAVVYLLDYLHALPVEPVGVGAKWQVDGTFLRNGITMRLIQTHELVALDAGSARTEMTERQEAPRQRVTAFVDDALTTFDVVTLTGGGSGRARVAFDRPLAVATTSKFDFETTMTINRPQLVQQVDMTMHGDNATELE